MLSDWTSIVQVHVLDSIQVSLQCLCVLLIKPFILILNPDRTTVIVVRDEAAALLLVDAMCLDLLLNLVNILKHSLCHEDNVPLIGVVV